MNAIAVARAPVTSSLRNAATIATPQHFGPRESLSGHLSLVEVVLATVKPIVVSFSELDAFRQCPHKHELAYKQRWVPHVLSPALTKGREWHAVMQLHYECLKAGTLDIERRREIAEYLIAVEQWDEELAGLLAWMYDGYEERWGTDSDWEILAVEDQRLIRLPTTTGRASRYYLRMRIDLLVHETFLKGKMLVVDHKSGQNLPRNKDLDLDDQFGLYTWGARTLGDPIFGSLYNAARTQRNKSPMELDERFSRTRVYRTDRELDIIAREAFVTARTAYSAYAPGEAPRFVDSAAIGPHRCVVKCPFTEPCLMGRKAGKGAEQSWLRSSYTQLTEEEQLAERGYIHPMMPGEEL